MKDILIGAGIATFAGRCLRLVAPVQAGKRQQDEAVHPPPVSASRSLSDAIKRGDLQALRRQERQ